MNKLDINCIQKEREINPKKCWKDYIIDATTKIHGLKYLNFYAMYGNKWKTTMRK